MALAKFSKFKKERAIIKEARMKEKKIANFKKLFNEKLGEMGASSVADLSEDQINKLLSSLGTVNEDRMREIEANVIKAGEPKEAGQAGEVNKSTGFDSPQEPDMSAQAGAQDLVGEDDEVSEAEVTKADLDKVAKKAEDAEKRADKAEAAADDAQKQADEAGDKAEAADKAAEKAKDKAAGGGDIDNDKDFEKYAMDVLKKAHPDDFDEKVAQDVINGLKKKHDGDYGAMIGALTSGFGG